MSEANSEPEAGKTIYYRHCVKVFCRDGGVRMSYDHYLAGWIDVEKRHRKHALWVHLGNNGDLADDWLDKGHTGVGLDPWRGKLFRAAAEFAYLEKILKDAPSEAMPGMAEIPARDP